MIHDNPYEAPRSATHSAVLGNSAETAAVSIGRLFGWGFVVVVVLLNLCALGVAWGDGSWVALGIALVYGPLMNILLILFALLAIFVLRSEPGFALTNHLAVCIGTPLLAIFADFVVISSMTLHGC